MTDVNLTGWVEIEGQKISARDLERIIADDPKKVCRLGGEFFLSWGNCRARDHFGIIPGDCPKGSVICGGEYNGGVFPSPPAMLLGDAIIEAVRLRSDEGITAMSGGVDSTLVAAIARRECLVVGIPGSHDIRQARAAAAALGLKCSEIEIDPAEIEEVVPEVLEVIPLKDPVNTSIALTQYFIARHTAELGHRRILAGQGADELFGGYARYLSSANLEEELGRDFASLDLQVQRDQAVAELHGVYLSMPYMDTRVVRAARVIPAADKVNNGFRKIPLRRVAERHIPREFAWYEKKAMQYGSGVWGILKKLARHNGYKTSVQGYLDQIQQVNHGH